MTLVFQLQNHLVTGNQATDAAGRVAKLICPDNTLASRSFTGAAIGDLSCGWDEHALAYRLQSATESKTPHLAQAMSGYGFSVGSRGYDDENRGLGFQPAIQNRAHNPCFAPAIYSQKGEQTIAGHPSGAAADRRACAYIYANCIDESVMRGDSGGLRYCRRNQQYSITAVSDGGGSVVERYAYSAYGEVTIADASGSVISNSAIANRYTYTGREWDEGLSLYHYRARTYDAVTGRFVSRDPMGFQGSEWNLFECVSGFVMLRTLKVRFS